MQATHLYLVRHGETEFNRRHIVQGRCVNGPLNETGRRQAALLAERFGDVPLDAIYTSTLLRARETAATVAGRHPGLSVHELRDLEEMSWGDYEGQPASPDVQSAFAELVARWQQGAYDLRIPGGESIREVQERGLRAVAHMLEAHAGHTLLVVAHGRFLRVLIASLLAEYGLARMEELRHRNTCVNHLIHEDGHFTAHLLNCTAHLDVPDVVANA